MNALRHLGMRPDRIISQPQDKMQVLGWEQGLIDRPNLPNLPGQMSGRFRINRSGAREGRKIHENRIQSDKNAC